MDDAWAKLFLHPIIDFIEFYTGNARMLNDQQKKENRALRTSHANPPNKISVVPYARGWQISIKCPSGSEM